MYHRDGNHKRLASADSDDGQRRIQIQVLALEVPELDQVCAFNRMERMHAARAALSPAHLELMRQDLRCDTIKSARNERIRRIRMEQRKSDLVFPPVAFGSLVYEMGHYFSISYSFTAESLDMLQVATEGYLIELLRIANLNAIHARRLVLQPKDLWLARRTCGELN